MDARVPRTCQNSCCYMQIDILHAEDYLQHIRWTRRRHDLEQSIPILCGHGPAATLSLKSLDQLNSIYTVHGPYNDPRDKRRGYHKCINANGGRASATAKTAVTCREGEKSPSFSAQRAATR